jgi:hypothetical protein
MEKRMDYIPINNCYVYVRDLRNTDPVGEEVIIAAKKTEFDFYIYPEYHLTFTDKTQYIPYIRSIVTEEPYLISCYSREFVWVIEDGVWKHPNTQTFGTSVSIITHEILKYEPSMPLLPLKGLNYIKKLRGY